jgi:hypothetical protein
MEQTFESMLSDLEVVPSEPEHHEHSTRQPFTTAAEALRFMLAGRATVTFQGRESRFTYKISKPVDKETGKVDANSQILFVSLLNGADNESSYQYLGYIKRGVYFHGRKSKVGADAKSAKAFDWTYRNLSRGVMPTGLEIWHEGRCGKCGRKLTVPESIASGFGPECIQHMH